MLDLSDHGILIDDSLPVAWISGDSGTGKTYLFEKIRELIKIGDPRVKGILLVTSGENFQYSTLQEDISSARLVIIDRWEMLVKEFPDLVDYLNQLDIPIIVFGRENFGLRVLRIWIGELVVLNGILQFSFLARRVYT